MRVVSGRGKTCRAWNLAAPFHLFKALDTDILLTSNSVKKGAEILL